MHRIDIPAISFDLRAIEYARCIDGKRMNERFREGAKKTEQKG